MTSGGQTFRYQAYRVWPDVARGLAGFAVTAGPLPWLLGSPIPLFILGGLSVAFAIFTAVAVRRMRTVVRLDEFGISTSGSGGATVSWNDMQAVDLSYFSTRRDRERGWMQLRVRGNTGTIRIDSSLDGFRMVADRAIAAATARDLPITETTLANMSALASGELDRPREPVTQTRSRR